jgi:hypothetical protein
MRKMCSRKWLAETVGDTELSTFTLLRHPEIRIDSYNEGQMDRRLFKDTVSAEEVI